MSTRRRRRRVVNSGVEKWRNKKWLELKAPDYMGDQSLGQTPTSELGQVIGRTIDMSLMDITEKFSDLNYQVKFKVTKIVGNRAHTEFIGQSLNRDYRRSQIRNHRSQIEGVFNLTLNDGSRVRITAFAITFSRAAHKTKREIRASMLESITEIVGDLNFPAFVNKLLSYELKKDLLLPASDIFPIKLLEISKVKVLRLPEDRRMMNADDLEVSDDVEFSPLSEDVEEEENNNIEKTVEEETQIVS